MNVVAGSWVRHAARASASGSRRALHATNARRAVTNLQMPAMSPTMKEGGISSWKVKEGDSYAAGDVLLEIETDKATIDVEAQEDGILGKIILNDGAKGVAVGKVIALLAEEGDDISNLEAPKEEESSSSKQESASSPKEESSPPPASSSKSSSKPSFQSSSSTESPKAPKAHSHGHPTHSRPLFPSVMRLLVEHGVEDAEKIKGTGIRGMLTKGDVLAFLGKASGPLGTYKESKKEAPKAVVPKKDVPKQLDGAAVRIAILEGMLKASKPKSLALPENLDFDSIISDYLPAQKAAAPKTAIPPPVQKASGDWLEGLV